MDLVETAEQLRKIQAQCNAYGLPLAHISNAWGALDRAIKDLLTEHYVTQGHKPQYTARKMANRVVREVHDNGEDIAYNMDLLARGEIEIRLA